MLGLVLSTLERDLTAGHQVLAHTAGGRVLTSDAGADKKFVPIRGDVFSKGNWTWTSFADIAVDATCSVWCLVILWVLLEDQLEPMLYGSTLYIPAWLSTRHRVTQPLSPSIGFFWDRMTKPELSPRPV